jgi:hypothetical protein
MNLGIKNLKKLLIEYQNGSLEKLVTSKEQNITKKLVKVPQMNKKFI